MFFCFLQPLVDHPPSCVFRHTLCAFFIQILVVLGVNGISGPLSVLLAQAAIPVTMIASIIFLRVRFLIPPNFSISMSPKSFLRCLDPCLQIQNPPIHWGSHYRRWYHCCPRPFSDEFQGREQASEFGLL